MLTIALLKRGTSNVARAVILVAVTMLSACGFTVGDPDSIASLSVDITGDVPVPRTPLETEMSETDAAFFERTALREGRRDGYVVVEELTLSPTRGTWIVQELPPQAADEPDRCFQDDVYMIRLDVEREVVAVPAGACLPDTEDRRLVVDGLFD